MTIATLDDICASSDKRRTNFFFKKSSSAAVIGRPMSTFGMSGNPPPPTAVYRAALNGEKFFNGVNDPLGFKDPAITGSYWQNHTFDRVHATAYANDGVFWLCDRIWEWRLSPTSATAQTITMARDFNRDFYMASLGTGINLGVEIGSTMGSGTPTMTASYTNEAGTSGRTATGTLTGDSAAPTDTFYPMFLNANDEGVRSVQSFTFSATWTSGTVYLVAYKVVAIVNMQSGGVTAINSGFPIISAVGSADNAHCLFGLFIPNATTAPYLIGSISGL